jgi:2-dehydro-3-deoxy-D-arabinonate dehydratase
MNTVMHLYRTHSGPVLEEGGCCYRPAEDNWDLLINRDDLHGYLEGVVQSAAPFAEGRRLIESELLPPTGSQEVWAAGVTYFRSRDARMEEAHDAGGGDFYDRVYSAERPELFFKSSPHRVVGHGQAVRIRRDSRWNVPEPEVTLLVTSGGRIVGYTVGNDMSSRDIEGENPLYLPQAKVYDGSCALGPGIYVPGSELPASTAISLSITREGQRKFEGSTTLEQLKRSPRELVEFLFMEDRFPAGCFLMTGTGIVPPATFTLSPGDEVRITVDSVGTLVNRVA